MRFTLSVFSNVLLKWCSTLFNIFTNSFRPSVIERVGIHRAMLNEHWISFSISVGVNVKELGMRPVLGVHIQPSGIIVYEALTP